MCRFTDAETHPFVKGAFHGGLLILAVPIWTFNLLAYVQRRDTRNLVNLVAFSGLIGLEVVNVMRHLQPDAPRPE